METKKHVILRMKGQACLFMAGLFLLLSVMEKLPVMAAQTEKKEVQTELTQRKEKALEWVKSVSRNSLPREQGVSVNSACNTLAVLRWEGQDADNGLLSEMERNKEEKNCDELAHLVWACGEETDLQALFERQNEDGGFGLTEEYTSDLYDTALVLMAAASLRDSVSESGAVPEDKLESAISYVISGQNEDGGFGYMAKDASRPGLSAEIGILLSELGIEDEQCYERLDAYCSRVFQGDFTKEKFYEQAELARYLYKRGIIADSDRVEEQLLKLQEENGSINNDLPDTLQYILLMNEIQDYYELRLKIKEFTTQPDTYILEVGKSRDISVDTHIRYEGNQDTEAVIRHTLFEDGVEKMAEEADCYLAKDETECAVSSQLTVSPQENHSYVLRTELVAGREEKVYAEYEITFRLYKTEDLVLTAEKGQEGSADVRLAWNDISHEECRYGYRLYRKKGETAWETCSTWSGQEKVKVLNVYPDGYNYLTGWMNSAIGTTEETAGKGLLDIEAVAFSKYNSDAANILKDETGNYKYDVVMMGSADCNGGCDLSESAYEATREFTDTGRGILFGHDSVVNNKAQVHKNLARFGESLGVTFHRSGSAIGGASVEVINEGLLTSYPWKITGKLTIPYSHSSGQFVEGELGKGTTEWMRFTGIQADDDAYLISRNQFAMIQTGHSYGQATDDERKILANTLFYLKQFTGNTTATDKAVRDEEAPEILAITTVSENNMVTIEATDRGTPCQYYVEAVSITEGERDVRQSNIVETEAVSGIRGYIVCVDDNENPLGNLAEYEEEELVEAGEGTFSYQMEELQPGESAYLHVCAVDYAGNVSEEAVHKVEKAPEEPGEEEPIREKEYLQSTYALIATEGVVDISGSEANITGDIYGKEQFRFWGSILRLKGKARSGGTISAGGSIVEIQEKEEGVTPPELPDYRPDILKDMEAGGQMTELSVYENTPVTTPTLCDGTSGAYGNTVDIQAELFSKQSILLSGARIQCGTEMPVVLCASEGDITISGSSFSGSGLIYAPKGNVTIRVSDFGYTGTIIAKNIKIEMSRYNHNQ